MSGQHRTIQVRGEAYDVWTAPEEIIILGEAGEHDGYRVRYRRRGELKWSAVLLVDHDHEPYEAELVAAIAFDAFGELPAASS